MKLYEIDQDGNIRIPTDLIADRPKISDKAVRLYGLIVSTFPASDGWREVQVKTLTHQLRVGENKIRRLTAQLVAKGWLIKEGKGGARYWIYTDRWLGTFNQAMCAHE